MNFIFTRVRNVYGMFKSIDKLVCKRNVKTDKKHSMESQSESELKSREKSLDKIAKLKNQKNSKPLIYKRKYLFGVLIVLINFICKTYNIENGNRVIWDEAHFGKFGSRYLKREFYFDVHPPLGKMLTALSGYLFGQDIEFKFESGSEYPSSVNYTGMRRFHAAMGTFIPLFGYGVFLNLGYGVEHSFLSSLLYVFENGICSITRLILLDSSLMLFTASTTYFFTSFFKNKQKKNRSFLREIIDLFCLGLSLGCVMSVKWIGCLTTSLIGIFIIHELWVCLMSKEKIDVFISKFIVRAFTLIMVPIIIYLFWFLIHFKICNNSTTDEAHMSSLFQAKLKNNPLNESRKYIVYGSIITLKSSKSAGGNLHSHAHTYPESNFNQITTYFHKDENNHWAFQKVVENNEAADFLSDNDEVVLWHKSTKTYLGADQRKAHQSIGNRAIGVKGQITKNCVWLIETFDDVLGREIAVKSVTTRFRLKNKETGLYLNWSGKHYPEWGFSQGEVTCIEEKDAGTLWNVEENKFQSTDNENGIEKYNEIRDFRSGFLSHVLELNRAMYNTNKSLIQDQNFEPVRIVSRPYEWFLMIRGLRMNGWEDEKYKFYMFGNPLIWYTSCIAVIASPIILLIRSIFFLRKYNKRLTSLEFFEVFLGFGGWAIHYLPFFTIGRVLYFHHYFPALFFAIICINYVAKQLKLLFIKKKLLYRNKNNKETIDQELKRKLDCLKDNENTCNKNIKKNEDDPNDKMINNDKSLMCKEKYVDKEENSALKIDGNWGIYKIRNEKGNSNTLFRIFVGLCVISYIYFSPLTYGIKGPASDISNKKWVNSWDFT